MFGFGIFLGGILIGVLAVVLAIFGFTVMLGLIAITPVSFNIPLGIIILVIALFLFAFGWYPYKSGKPQGTVNVTTSNFLLF